MNEDIINYHWSQNHTSHSLQTLIFNILTSTSITEKVTATLALYPHIRAVVAIGEGDKGDGAIAWEDFLNLSSDPDPEQVMINFNKTGSSGQNTFPNK